METKKFHLMTLSTKCSVPLFSTYVDAVSWVAGSTDVSYPYQHYRYNDSCLLLLCPAPVVKF